MVFKLIDLDLDMDPDLAQQGPGFAITLEVKITYIFSHYQTSMFRSIVLKHIFLGTKSFMKS
jgi:hypothetical protein